MNPRCKLWPERTGACLTPGTYRRLRGWLRRWTHTAERTPTIQDIHHALRVRARRRKGWR